MADIKDINVYQTVSSVSFEIQPNTDIININKITIEGTGVGSQNLQQVTDIGASTTNTITLNPIVNTNGLNINTTFDENIGGISTAINIIQNGEGNGIYINTPNGKALEILGGGSGTGVIVDNVDVGIQLSPAATGLVVDGGTSESINITNTSGTGIRVYQNIDSAIELNLGSTAKGVIINSGTSSNGNPIVVNKNGIDKLTVNQQGELTATKLIKEGGTSSQYLMADGSISSGGGIKNTIASGTDVYTAIISGVTSYTDGDAYLVRFTNGNTSNCTLNINSLGAITLYRNNDGALIGGDIQSGGEMLCVYNSTLNTFQCIGTSPNCIITYVTNVDSVTITKGQPVYAFGGIGDRMTVKRALNVGDSTSAQTVGIVMSNSIASNQKGFIITQGLLDGLSNLPTSTFVDGDAIYLGSTAGAITKVKPSAPNHLVYLGTVTTASNGSAGRMYVRIQNGYELDELHNVAISGLVNNDSLIYENSTQLWKNKQIGLQQVTNVNALTTNPITVTANTSSNVLEVTNNGVGNAIVAISNNNADGGNYAIEAYSYNGLGGAGLFYSDACDALAVNCNYGGGYALSLYSIGGGSQITANTNTVQILNQSLNNKGLVINSGTSSTGNFIELAKNGINKLIANQAGELTATKLIKEGGTSAQFLKANGDIDSTIYAPSASPTFTGTVALPKTTTINTYNPIVNIVKDVVPTTPITGTLTETIFNSYLIPANTFSANDMMKIPYFEINKVGATTGGSMRIYVNTSNTLTGAVQIARYAFGTSLYAKITRQFNINAGVLTGFQFTSNNIITDINITGIAFSSTSFNPAIDNYIITTGALSLASESIQQRGFCVTN